MLDSMKYGRSAGVLLPVTMLSGPFGTGVLGAESKEFLDFLASSGFRSWQVLPVESTGYCFSPYKCVSAFAGEPMLIDPRMLFDMGLVSESEIQDRCSGMIEDYVDYEVVRVKQWKILRSAYLRADKKLYSSFTKPWLDDYALYMALKQRYDGSAWFSWPDEALRSFDSEAIHKARFELRDEIEFYRFVQWLFDSQWKELKDYAAARNISIIGDMPIYVSEDSVEVWSRRELFDADSDGNFAAVGGCPPDYFAPEGQLWGNPIYNWKLMRSEGYQWWIDRLRAAIERYDIVRLDHFRAFESYWRIPAGAKTAAEGKWVKGPGMTIFKALTDALGELPVFAEDLGVIDEKVEALLDKTGYRGLRVMQFAYKENDHHLPHNYTRQTVAYTGTHDNTTLLAWHQELDDDTRAWALEYVGFAGDWTQGGPNCAVNKAWFRALYMSGASLVILPIQDMLGYGADTRTNTPGTAEGNWKFRIRPGVLEQIDKGFYRELAHISFRDGVSVIKNV